MGQCYTKKDKKDKKDLIIVSENPIDTSSSCGSSPIELKTCSICLEEIRPLHQFTLPQCKHQFHRTCIADWNKRSKECPNCRGPIVDDLNSKTKIAVSDFVRQFLLERERLEEEENNNFHVYNRNRYNNVVLRSRRVVFVEEVIAESEDEEFYY